MARASLMFRVSHDFLSLKILCLTACPSVAFECCPFTHPLVVERMHSSIVIAHRPTFRWSEVETIVFTTTHPYFSALQSNQSALMSLNLTDTVPICYVALKPSLDPCKSLQLCLS
jgi:hypothetical protein